jgi:hypothetical protein
MLVVMPVVLSMAAAVMDVIDVVTVRNCDVATAFAMGVVVALMSGVLGGFTLVVMAIVRLVQVPIVGVVDVVSVRDGNVATTLAVFVVVRGVFWVLRHISQRNRKWMSLRRVRIS